MSCPLNGSEKKKQLARLKARDGTDCYWCGIALRTAWAGPTLPDDARTIDHIIPLSMGGTNHLDNLLLACNQCNNKRGNQLPPPSFWKCEFLATEVEIGEIL